MIRITWLAPEVRLEHELRQLREEGTDARTLEVAWSERPDDEVAARALAVRLLDEAHALARDDPGTVDDGPLPPGPKGILSATSLQDKLHAAWLGRSVGCLLGKPVEKVPRDGIRTILESIDEWPLRRYFTAEGVPDAVTERYPWNRASRPTSMRENIVCMPEDDDLNYAMLNLGIVERYGLDFTTDDVATTWLSSMPVLTVFTAERVAYENLLNYRVPPETARFRNPYREWIGAQIRADVWGWLSPGDPRRAAERAQRDARLSHTGNGVLAERFVAAMVAQAFIAHDIGEVIDAGLDVIPAESRLAEAIRFTRALPYATSTWEGIVDALYERYGHYHWVHAINNAALLTAALCWGNGDFDETITCAVMGGWDTDCNGATAGSIVGVMKGTAAIADTWSAPLDNRVQTSLKGFDGSRLDELAARTFAQVPSDVYGP